MSNLAPLLMSIVGGGTGTVAVAAARWVGDERARRKVEKTAAARAPLQQKSLELRVAEQAEEIRQGTIDTLRENYALLQKEFADYKREVAEQRKRDLEERERERKNDHDELDRARTEIKGLRQEIHDLNAGIVRMEFELQRYRSAAGP